MGKSRRTQVWQWLGWERRGSWRLPAGSEPGPFPGLPWRRLGAQALAPLFLERVRPLAAGAQSRVPESEGFRGPPRWPSARGARTRQLPSKYKSADRSPDLACSPHAALPTRATCTCSGLAPGELSWGRSAAARGAGAAGGGRPEPGPGTSEPPSALPRPEAPGAADSPPALEPGRVGRRKSL